MTSQTYLQPSFNTRLLSLPRFNICFLSGFHIILILALPGVLVSTVGLCIVVACPVDPMVDTCPVIEPVVEPVFWVVGPVVRIVEPVVWVVGPVVRIVEPVVWVVGTVVRIVGPVVWVAVLIRLHSFNVIVVFT